MRFRGTSRREGTRGSNWSALKEEVLQLGELEKSWAALDNWNGFTPFNSLRYWVNANLLHRPEPIAFEFDRDAAARACLRVFRGEGRQTKAAVQRWIDLF